jgi:hypothetical protein
VGAVTGDDTVAGQTFPPLCGRGRRQAQALGAVDRGDAAGALVDAQELGVEAVHDGRYRTPVLR